MPKKEPAKESGTETQSQIKTIESRVPAGNAPEAPDETKKRFRRLSIAKSALHSWIEFAPFRERIENHPGKPMAVARAFFFQS